MGINSIVDEHIEQVSDLILLQQMDQEQLEIGGVTKLSAVVEASRDKLGQRIVERGIRLGQLQKLI